MIFLFNCSKKRKEKEAASSEESEESSEGLLSSALKSLNFHLIINIKLARCHSTFL